MRYAFSSKIPDRKFRARVSANTSKQFQEHNRTSRVSSRAPNRHFTPRRDKSHQHFSPTRASNHACVCVCVMVKTPYLGGCAVLRGPWSWFPLIGTLSLVVQNPSCEIHDQSQVKGSCDHGTCNLVSHGQVHSVPNGMGFC